MRLFVTGGTGFIGKPLCKALAGHEVLALALSPPADSGKGDSPRLCDDHASMVPAGGPFRQMGAVPFSGSESCRYLKGDIFEIERWKDAVAQFQPEACLHLAWAGLPDYSYPTSLKNFQAGLQLIEFLRDIRCPRVVVAGTCFEYGNLTGCLAEDRHPQTQGLFAAFKASQRLVATSLLAGSATTLLWARPFFVYGPGQRPTSLVPSCYRALCEGRKPDIKSPDVLNDFIHVDDVAGGMAALATSAAPGGDYNLGSGEPARIRDVANLVARLMGLPAVFEPSAAPGVGFWADLTRMRTLTTWRPKFSLEEGVRSTLDAWRAAT